MQLRVAVMCVCALLLTGLAPSGPALADDYNDANDGNWTTPGTWVGGGAYPGSGDTATLDSNTVTLDTSLLTGDNAPSLITMGGGTLSVPGEGWRRTVDSPIAGQPTRKQT